MKSKLKTGLARLWQGQVGRRLKRSLLKLLLTDEEKFFFSLLAPEDAVGTNAQPGYLYRWGWRKTHDLVFPYRNAAGQALPWFTFPAIAFLEECLQPGLRILEFGAGSSSLYFSARGLEVWALEHDETFANRLRAESTTNIQLQVGDYSTWTTAQLPAPPFAIAVVDGIERVKCVELAQTLLDPVRGVLILDDSHRVEYQPAREHLLGLGYRELPFYGLRSKDVGGTGTSFFYRPGNCLGI